jgi:hypothetical protein
MKRLLLAGAIALATTPAFAWEGGDNGNNNGPTQVHGCVNHCGGGSTSTSASNATSSANANASAKAGAYNRTTVTTEMLNRMSLAAAQHQSQSVNFSPTINVGRGTGGGSAGTAPARGTTAGASDPAGSGYTGYSITNNTVRQAPDVYVPSIGGGGADCPVVGFGVGGSGLAGGGGFGPSWISSRCDHRQYAKLIYELTGNRQKALDYLASVESDVKDWLKSEQQ